MSSPFRVPFVDLALQHARIEGAVRDGFDQVLATTAFINGPAVASFEDAFGSYCGVDHAVAVANGTDALEIALAASGVGTGDEVIVPANTFVATAEAVLRVGAGLVLADCDDDFLLDPDEVARCLSPRTRAVVAVHLYGQAAPVEQLRDVVGEQVLLVEDAAQAQGARRHGTRAGGLGDVAATSFYPGKNLGAYGDAGCVLTSSSAVATRARRLRNHGGVGRYEHEEVGRNSRMDELQAVVLSAKLRLLDVWNEERRQAAARYDALLSSVPDVVVPRSASGNEHVYHLYVVRVPHRDRVLGHLERAGVAAGVHYPTPLHRLPAMRHLPGARQSFKKTEAAAAEILSLPMFPGITEAQQELVATALAEALL